MDTYIVYSIVPAIFSYYAFTGYSPIRSPAAVALDKRGVLTGIALALIINLVIFNTIETLHPLIMMIVMFSTTILTGIFWEIIDEWLQDKDAAN